MIYIEYLMALCTIATNIRVLSMLITIWNMPVGKSGSIGVDRN